MSVNTGDVLEVAFHHRSAIGYPQVMVRHFECTQSLGPLPFPEQNLADYLSSSWSNIRFSWLPPSSEYVGVVMRKVLPDGEDIWESTQGEGDGNVGFNPLPSQTALRLRFFPQDARPTIRSFCYLPSPSVGFSESPGVPTGFCLNVAITLGEFLRSSFTLGTLPSAIQMRCCVWSRVYSESYAISSVSAATKWASQRRRSSYRIQPHND